MKTRRTFLKTFSAGALASALPVSFLSCSRNNRMPRPNVILIMTDDQGYGDLGIKGNPLIRTPNIDALARESAEMIRFYVSPVCAPTRASLMTGRYNYRTRCIDTFLGRAMMDPDEVTIAEIMRKSGYATGIFGKWHLGDNYPMRPQDQGFEESLVHRGGGIGQQSDPPGGEGKYTDPILFHNGVQVQEKGFCTDIYFQRAMQWMEQSSRQGRNFFAYIATNAPHSPFRDVPEELYQQYKKLNLENDRFPQDQGHPLPDKADTDKRARIYAMITNIDDNVGKLLKKLDELGLADNTIVIFMTDNGPNGRRYVAGMKGKKTEVYEGGIRSPFFFRWPARIKPGLKSDRIAAHIDVLPTVLDACNIPIPHNVKLDGKSLLPLLTGEKVKWADRYIVIQAHRGDRPVLYHNFAIMNQRWKLLHASGFGKESFQGEPRFELYDMLNDPLEMNDIADQKPDIVMKLKRAYEQWFDDVSNSRPDNYAPPRIYIGTKYENPVTLTRQNWRRIQENPRKRNAKGHWLLYAASAGTYDVRVRFRPMKTSGQVILRINDENFEKRISKGQSTVLFQNIAIEKGNLNLQAFLETERKSVVGAWQVDVIGK